MIAEYRAGFWFVVLAFALTLVACRAEEPQNQSASGIGNLPTAAASDLEKEMKEPVPTCIAKLGATDEFQFRTFDREFRQALASSDPTLLSLLAFYPLNINESDGNISVNNAATLYRKASFVFPDVIRSRVLEARPGNMVCDSYGIGYDGGKFWITRRTQGNTSQYGIAAINLPEDQENTRSMKASKQNGVRFVCRADRHRIVVDAEHDTLRYRSWNRPHFATERPDLELRSGTEKTEGKGACRYRLWEFKNGDVTYVVAELGCGEKPPPDGAYGELDLNSGGSTERLSWCF